MLKILHITASIRGSASVSRALSEQIVQNLTADTEAEIVSRDLSQNDLPFIDDDRFAANRTPDAERSPAQRALAATADTLIEELQSADIIVFGVPIYNFSVPATVKAWADLVARSGTTFQYSENGPVGMLKHKAAYVAVATGGTKVGSEIDFMTPWLRYFLEFLGIHDIKMVSADAIMGADGEERIEQAKAEAQALVA